MLIIFDLDDTLIDTSGCITYHKLEDALRAMVREGLDVGDFDAALEQLRRLDRTSESARFAVAEFVEILGADKRFVEIGVKEIYENLSPDIPIFPLDGALDLLADLKDEHQIALVTMGSPSLQMEKLKKAGIDSSIFSKIAVSEDRNKKLHYQMIVEELGYPPSSVLVCGDRIPLDLAPARELGYKTVHVQWGRGLLYAKRDADYRISQLKEIKNIVKELTSV